MGKRDPRVDAYIARAAAFARPILERLRAAVHAGCPLVVESLKWGTPAYDHHGPLALSPAFKAHCRFVLWKRVLVRERLKPADVEALRACDHLVDARSLPAKRVLIAAVKAAAAINEAGLKAPRRASAPKRAPAVPADLKAALAKHRRAAAGFAALSPSARRDYVEWIVSSKQAATRAKRLATAIEWIAAGKRRNWKYETR